MERRIRLAVKQVARPDHQQQPGILGKFARKADRGDRHADRGLQSGIGVGGHRPRLKAFQRPQPRRGQDPVAVAKPVIQLPAGAPLALEIAATLAEREAAAIR